MILIIMVRCLYQSKALNDLVIVNRVVDGNFIVWISEHVCIAGTI